MKILLFVFLGGGLGSLARFGTGKALQELLGTQLMPWGTIAANVLACLIFGFAVHRWGGTVDMNSSLRAVLLIGFCGGYSTFSSFGFESFQLIKQGHTYLALANILISLVLCIGIFFLMVKKIDL